METALLRCFLTVCDTQSFSLAAGRLNLTQSTVSHQISRLEQHLDVQLFERTTRRCVLTRAGQELVPFANRILRGVEDMEEAFKPHDMSGRVVIGAPDDHILFDVMTLALKDFMLSRPNIAVEMRAGLAVDHFRGLREGLLDLALVREIGRTPEALRHEQLVWVSASEWDMPQEGPVYLALVGAGTGCIYRQAAAEALDGASIGWKCQFSCTSLDGALSVVRAGLALSAIPAGELQPWMRVRDAREGLPALPDVSLSLHLSHKEPTNATRALARTLTRCLGGAQVSLRGAT